MISVAGLNPVLQRQPRIEYLRIAYIARTNDETLQIIVENLSKLKGLSVAGNVEMKAVELILLLAFRRRGTLRRINLRDTGFSNREKLVDSVSGICEDEYVCDSNYV